MGYKEVWAYFQSTGGEGFYAYADVEWDSSYYVTIGNIRYSSESSAYWFKWRVGARGNTGSPLAGTDLGPKYSFQGSQNGQYVFQACTRESASSWGGTWDSGGFTLTADSGDSGGGDSGGGESSNSYYVTYHDRDGTTLAQTTETEGQYFIAQSGSSVTRPGSSSTSSNYTITGDANGGAFSNGSTTASITATETTTISYSFSSWNTNSSGTGSTYYAGSYYTMPSYNLNLYPVFSSSSSTVCSNHSLSRLPQPSYAGSTTSTLTATFNANGGSVSTTSQSVDATITKIFGGWMNSSGTVIASLNSAGTVKAKWNNSYSNNTLVLPLPSRSGYNFNGWSTSTSGTNLQPAGKTVSITSNVTYYAIWTEKEKPKGGIFIHDGTIWQLITSYIYDGDSWKTTE